MSSMSMRPGQLLQFGKFRIDVPARTLRREGAIVKLNSRVFDVLLYLVQNPGRVLARDELLKNIWPDAFVDEHSLAQSISVLRRALEEKPGDNSYIVTLPGRGYQFVSEVQVVAPEICASERGNTLPEVATDGRSNSSGLLFQKHTVETSVITSEEKKPLSQGRLLIRTLAAVLVAAVAVALVLRLRMPRQPEQKHELSERQLTANPPENSINFQTISRDGKYLAYTDFLSKNLYLLAIDSGETRQLALPAQYQPVDWFPDGNHLLLLSAANGGDLWKMSTWDSSLRRLWSGTATYAAVSPDGLHIAFVKDNREIWLMGADGEEPHKILAGDVRGVFAIAWSPTGQRLAYLRFRDSGNAIETCDLAGGAPTVVLSDSYLYNPEGAYGIAWLPDDRVVYSVSSKIGESDLWAIRADSSTGKQSGDATRLASWKNFDAEVPQASADGKRLIAAKFHIESSIYIGDLAFGNKGFTPHRFTPDGWYDEASAWTKDSKAIFFESKRQGRWAIFKQDIHAQTPETLIAGSENYTWAKPSAQGTLLFSATASPAGWEDDADPSFRLMSTPEQGGARTTLMMGRHEYRCGSTPSSRCVVAQMKDHQLVFSELDPMKGTGEELASVAADEITEFLWDLSPDGDRLAIVDPSEHKGEIRILNLPDRRITALPVRDWKWQWLPEIDWAADGKSWFAKAYSGSSFALLSIDANGNPRVLYEVPAGSGDVRLFVPSPDGKRLAFTKWVFVTDVMLLENF